MRIGAGGPFVEQPYQDGHAPASIGEDDAGWGVVSGWVGAALRTGVAALTIAVGIAQANVNNQNDEIPKAPSVAQPTGQGAFSQRGQFRPTFVSFVGGDDIVPQPVVFRPDEQEFNPPPPVNVGPNSAVWPVAVDDDIVPVAAVFRPDEQDFSPPTAASPGPVIASWPLSVDDDIVPVAAAFRPEEQWFTPPTAARVETNSAVWPVFVEDEIVSAAVAFRPDEQDATPPVVVTNLVIAGWPSFVDEDAVPVTPPFRPEEQDFTPPTASKIDFSVSPVFVTDDIVPFVAATPSVEQPTGQSAFSQRGQFLPTFIAITGSDDIVPQGAAASQQEEQDFTPPTAAKIDPNVVVWISGDDGIQPPQVDEEGFAPWAPVPSVVAQTFTEQDERPTPAATTFVDDDYQWLSQTSALGPVLQTWWQQDELGASPISEDYWQLLESRAVPAVLWTAPYNDEIVTPAVPLGVTDDYWLQAQLFSLPQLPNLWVAMDEGEGVQLVAPPVVLETPAGHHKTRIAIQVGKQIHYFDSEKEAKDWIKAQLPIREVAAEKIAKRLVKKDPENALAIEYQGAEVIEGSAELVSFLDKFEKPLEAKFEQTIKRQLETLKAEINTDDDDLAAILLLL